MEKVSPIQFRVTDYIANVELYHKENPFFFDKTCIFWFWNKEKYCYEIVDEIDILNSIDTALNFYGTIQNGKARSGYINAFKSVGRRKIPKEAKKTWVQLRSKIIDVTTGEQTEATPEYFITNPLPWDISESDKTPVIDNLFNQWVGEKSVLLFQVLAFSMLMDYPIHRIFCLVGSGSNGKSKFLELLCRFVGHSNKVSTSLDLIIESRFETSKLYKKLLCLMGETNFNTLSRTEKIKKLAGQDSIPGEMKNKGSFDFINYAKLIIATNGLPITTDKTDGFYRRWLIIPFENKFTEQKDPLEEISEEEYKNLATKCVKILEILLKKREFYDEGSIQDRQKRYEETSNPLNKFIELTTIKDINGLIYKFDFKDRFISWLKNNGHREWTDREIGLAMKELYDDGRSDGKETDGKRYWIWHGLVWKPKEEGKNSSLNAFVQVVQLVQDTTPLYTPVAGGIQVGRQVGQAGQKKKILEILTHEFKKPVQIQIIVDRFKDIHNVQEDITLKAIQELEQQGDIFQPTPGYLKPLD